MQDFEKLGAFYLGRAHDVDAGETKDEVLLYDAKDLCTHALCVGMTGSGKTGLCISLLEEAAIDGIPALIIDPKGDMGNLMLNFPELAAKDFGPWIDPAEALRKGMEPDAYAEHMAGVWREGLASWGQDGERIQRLRDAADVAIYTPGSNAGIPLTVLRSFDAPAKELVEDSEAFADRIQSAVAGLLGLLDIDANPVQSREAILLSNILQTAWVAGEGLGIADLIRQIQSPPFERLGVLDVESFYPSKDRTGLAMRLNGLLASPSFAQWMEGEPLDIDKLLYTEKGKPRLAVLSIAHLSESERMFFVTTLLGEVVAWMRQQSGTSSLRALLYMDEIYGFFPPVKEPPSKRPMLTLLKQARAFGLGVVLATQNPVDLDYKGLSNIGTWFIGRLQTERDKARVLDGLEGAMTGGGKRFDRAKLDATLSGLGKRVFLMNNVHENGPVVFHTRWALSYLGGPLSRDRIKLLMADRRSADEASGEAAAKSSGKTGSAAASPRVATPEKEAPERPVAPPEANEGFLACRGNLSGGHRIVHRPALGVTAKVHYASARAKIDHWVDLSVLAPFDDDDVVWDEADYVEGPELKLRDEPDVEGTFAELPAAAGQAKSYTGWQRDLKKHLYQEREIVTWKCPETKLVSQLGEGEGAFRARVVQAAHEKRDMTMEKLRGRYIPKLERVRERIRKAEEKVGKEEEQYESKRSGSWIKLGTSLLGALTSRKLSTSSRKLGSAARSMRTASKEKADIARAERDLDARREELAELEERFEGELAELDRDVRAEDVELESITIRPRKTDLDVDLPRLVWVPWKVDGQGIAERVS